MERKQLDPEIYSQVNLIEKHIPGLLSRNEVEFIMHCVSEAPPNTQYVDLGTYLGKSAAAICAAGTDRASEIITIDRFKYKGRLGRSSPKIVRRNLAQLNFYPTIITGSSSGTISPRINNVGFLFIDTHHTATQLNRELNVWSPRLVRGAIVALHDYYPNGVYPKYVAAINHYFRDKWEFLGLKDTIIGFRKP